MESEPRPLDLRNFLSDGPCRQRPGMRTKSGRVITTCPECHGLMFAGECARDKLRAALDTKDRTDA